MATRSPILLSPDPLPLDHSWPLFEREARFDLGWLHDPIEAEASAQPIPRDVGRWGCDLADNALTWSSAVYDIFGLPHGELVTRTETVALYSEGSRAAMERLRAYAIRHRRGFTLDAEIRPAQGPARWMRLTAAPVCEDKRVIQLEGLKQDVTALYR